jgi:hypothetical protein
MIKPNRTAAEQVEDEATRKRSSGIVEANNSGKPSRS